MRAAEQGGRPTANGKPPTARTVEGLGQESRTYYEFTAVDPSGEALQPNLHGRGYITVTSATWRMLDAVGFDLDELRELDLTDAEPLWRDIEGGSV